MSRVERRVFGRSCRLRAEARAPAVVLGVLLLGGAAGCSTARPPQAAERAGERGDSHGGALTLTIENDALTGSDNNYSNGVGLGWATDEIETLGEESFVRRWAEFWSFLPFVLDDGHRTYAAWGLGHEMHTPNEISDVVPPTRDQPYAGVVYLDSILAARGNLWEHRWNLRLGLVGPSSHADDMQTWYHDLIGSGEPLGWDNQLPDEPLVNIGYDAAYILLERNLDASAKFRVVPIGGAAVGTYFTGVSLGLYCEVGWNLVDAFGVSKLRSGFNAANAIGVGPMDAWSFSLFTSAAGFGVGHYLPLDGTVFRSSASVDSEPLLGTVTAGVTLRHGRLALGMAASYSSKSFATQVERTEYGTVSLAWFF
ncbi:MAG: DUF2219 family protein [Planctomycetaceae bacterium]|nr:DUF2219 family protein [Planctomycetaceae bacterium]